MTLKNVTPKDYKRMLDEPPPVVQGDPTKPRTRPQQIKVKGAHWRNAVYFRPPDTNDEFPHKDGPLSAAELKLFDKCANRGSQSEMMRRLAERLAKHGPDAP